ncbi:glycoside hydrolase clan GH-D [Catenulispora acidiphila DSM 44928]|uniref:Alpha-galactosidase n=1 Tax=Catenulispora acidiphila (strain DSM 44928 / JCM 14897 / NBRC 102108 / NRRL B-24433 / ID139908) TaxID=479433 RepID=C7Q739_CATAD|nr:alpha-galactosidase [Catenulispora acidiphila]ACU76052.1 glycoside hydrolase clan GH-D [Catenulispora acidiphila DSM 44928]
MRRRPPGIRTRTWTAAVGLALAAALLPPIGATAPAHAEDNGVGLTPALGWSSWSSVRTHPTAAKIDAQADAMKSSGLAAAGFQYVNVDDFWYQCPGSQGPNVDANGRWVTDATKFPASGSTNGIQAAANHVHADGLKFGLYVTPGVSQQAVSQNSAILGTSYHVKDIATTTAEKNYNCKGMVGIDYSKPGAQAFINSWADEFASWGVDYVKIDGVGTSDVPDLQAWSKALVQTGRPIHLELSNNLAIGSASTWQQYSNGWRTGGDIECYSKCTTAGTLTDWSHVQSRFGQVASWQPYGGPGAFNDYDSLEVGNGSATGLTDAEQQSQMSLWALAASPLILGTDLTNLNSTELGYLKNGRVLAVDQDAIDASRIVNNGNQQVYIKKEKDGSVIIGLFNYSGTGSTTVSVPLSAAGISGSATATDLWSGASVGTISGTYSVTLGAGAVKLIKVAPSGSGGSTTIEAEAAGNTIAGAAKIATCAACSGGHKVGYIGKGAANAVTINGITESAAGTHTLTISYLVSGTRSFSISVNGGPDIVEQLTGTSFATPATTSVAVQLAAGTNTIKFDNDTAYAPDLDAITVS